MLWLKKGKVKKKSQQNELNLYTQLQWTATTSTAAADLGHLEVQVVE